MPVDRSGADFHGVPDGGGGDLLEGAFAPEPSRREEMEAAHEAGEPYLWGTTTYGGEEVLEYRMPDGSIVYATIDGDEVTVVAMEWPDGPPVFVGMVYHDGEYVAMYETSTGQQFVVNENGENLGTVDELGLNEIEVPKWQAEGMSAKEVAAAAAKGEIDPHETVTVSVVPQGPPDYETHVVDAETGEVYSTRDTADTFSTPIGDVAIYDHEASDLRYYVDPSGVVVKVEEIPPEVEWTILGIITKTDDGNVNTDLGILEIDIDLEGPEKGFGVGVDVLVAEAGFGVEVDEDGWSSEFYAGVDVAVLSADASIALDSDGNFDIDLSAEADIGIIAVGGEISASSDGSWHVGGHADVLGTGGAAAVGQDSSGNFYMDLEATVGLTIGGFGAQASADLSYQQTDDGAEWSAGVGTRVEAFGAYAEANADMAIVVSDGDIESFHTSATLALGADGVGEIEIGAETKLDFEDGRLASTTSGVFYEVTDGGGDQVAFGGEYHTSNGGWVSADERLDDGTDYVRDTGEPDGPWRPAYAEAEIEPGDVTDDAPGRFEGARTEADDEPDDDRFDIVRPPKEEAGSDRQDIVRPSKDDAPDDDRFDVVRPPKEEAADGDRFDVVRPPKEEAADGDRFDIVRPPKDDAPDQRARPDGNDRPRPDERPDRPQRERPDRERAERADTPEPITPIADLVDDIATVPTISSSNEIGTTVSPTIEAEPASELNESIQETISAGTQQPVVQASEPEPEQAAAPEPIVDVPESGNDDFTVTLTQARVTDDVPVPESEPDGYLTYKLTEDVAAPDIDVDLQGGLGMNG